MTLIDTLVGIALMLVVFVGMYGLFILSIDVVTNNKARIGALALANEQMEYLRSLPYANVGTVGGIPAGTVPQNETVTINGVEYTRRVLVRYMDMPQDGTAGADQNGIIADVKHAEVSVNWQSHEQTRMLSLVSLFAPVGVESLVPGGTIAITVRTASDQVLSGASVRIVNASTTPAIDVTTVSDVLGQVVFIGAPAASGYQITVTKDGYSSAQTYTATASLPNPNPGHLTVSLNQTTSATFKIDVLGSYTLKTMRSIYTATWEDLFTDAFNIATSTNTEVAAGRVLLVDNAPDGSVTSEAVAPAYISAWTEASWVDVISSNNSLTYYVYSGDTLIPDASLPGNAAGFTVSPIDLSTVSTTTYPTLSLHGELTTQGSSPSPEIQSWRIIYDAGPEPIANVAYALVGEKTIGTTGAGVSVFKYNATGTSGSTAQVTIPFMEWDTYTLTIPSSAGYDIASSCGPQPTALNPGVALSTTVYLAPSTTNSLRVDVRTESGALIANAAATLSRGGGDTALVTDTCGQVFYPGLTPGEYTLSILAAGYQTYLSTVDVSGTTRLSVTMTP